MNEGELHGWKEIARYLGRSVRGAQRWERELGLPIRRLKTASGQAIFARRDEIEAWKAQIGEGPRELDRAESRVSARVIWSIAAVVVIVAAAGTAIMWPRIAGHPDPVAFAYEGTALVARRGDGTIVWQRDLGVRLDVEAAERMRPSFVRGLIEADADGDGVAEIFVVVPGNQAGRVLVPDTLISFSRNGNERWRYRPDASSLRFGPSARSFEGPWFIRDLVVAADGPAKGAWIAVSHHTWWPGAVYRLDDSARAQLAYVQSGAVYGLAITDPSDAPKVVAAGVINEIGAATLALLDPARPSSSPQIAGGEFECRNCPAGRPLKLVALPRSELNTAMPLPYNAVRFLRRVTGRFQAHVAEAHEAPGLFAASLFEFDETLNVRSRSFDDSYWTLHEQWRRAGRLTHDASACPERTRSLEVNEWDSAAGWRARAVASTPLPAPGMRASAF